MKPRRRWLRRLLNIPVICFLLVLAVLTALWVLDDRARARFVEQIRAEAEQHVPEKYLQEQDAKAVEAVRAYWDRLAGAVAHIDLSGNNHPLRKWTDARQGGEAMTAAHWQALRDFLQSNADVLELGRELAQGEGLRYPCALDEWIDSGVPHWHTVRKFGQVLYASAVMAAHSGDNEAALDDLLNTLGMARVLEYDPCIHSQYRLLSLVGGVIHGVEAAAPGSFSPRQAQELMASFRDLDLRKSAVTGMWGEVLRGLSEFEKTRDGKSDLYTDFLSYTLYTRADLIRTYSPGVLFFCRTIGRPLLNRDEVEYTRNLKEAIRATVLSYDEARPQMYQLEKRIRELPGYLAFSSSVMMPTRVYVSLARIDASIDLLELGLLIEQHQQEHGALPERLDALSEHFPEGIPLDPYTGEPYRYHTYRDHFVLYSLGDDREDDDGWHDYQDGDIAWRGSAQ